MKKIIALALVGVTLVVLFCGCGTPEKNLPFQKIHGQKTTTAVASEGYKPGVVYNGILYYVKPHLGQYGNLSSSSLCSLAAGWNSYFQEYTPLSIDDFLYVVGLTTDNELYITSRTYGSVKYNLRTEELVDLKATSFSGNTKDVVLAGLYADDLYFWSPDDMESILYRCDLNEPLSEAEEIFRAPERGWRHQYTVVGDTILHTIEHEERQYTVYEISLNDSSYTEKTCFTFDAESAGSMIAADEEYIICLAEGALPLLGDQKNTLFIYNRLTGETLQKAWVNYNMWCCPALDSSNERLYYWHPDSGTIAMIRFDDLEEGTYSTFSNGYVNEDIDVNTIMLYEFNTGIDTEYNFYLGDAGIQYCMTPDGDFYDLR